METSILLARIIGPLFILVGLGTLINTNHYQAMLRQFLGRSDLYYFSGALAFIIGSLMVSFHNIWVADWRVVITIIGWFSILKGVIRILFPGRGAQYADAFASTTTLRVGAVTIIAAGAWLCVMAFM